MSKERCSKVGVGVSYQRICASGPDGNARRHESYTSSARISLRPVRDIRVLTLVHSKGYNERGSAFLSL